MKKQILAILGMAMAMNCAAIKPSDMVPHDASVLPLLGTIAPDASKQYSRLPDSLKTRVREELWALGLNSAGMAVRFSSDATDIGARWKSLNKFSMNHMTATGIRGLDLYVLGDDNKWTTVGSARPWLSDTTTTTRIMGGMERRMREYMLYLPLYDGVDSLYILTDSAAVVAAPRLADMPQRKNPVVFYGTSITQGGCATRPGMIHTSMLERMLNREVINLGFSGNGKLDPEIAQLMAQVDASVYVLEMLPNCTSDMLRERLVAFYEILRKAHPDTPILFVESPMFPGSRHNAEEYNVLTEKNATLHGIYTSLLSRGDKFLFYMESERVMSNPEASVDNYHLTDLGFTDMAREFYPVLKTLIGQ